MAAISPYSTLAEIRLAAKVRFQTTSSCFPPRAWAEMAWAMASCRVSRLARY